MKYLIIAATAACSAYVIYTTVKIVFIAVAAKYAKKAIEDNAFVIKHDLDV